MLGVVFRPCASTVKDEELYRGAGASDRRGLVEKPDGDDEMSNDARELCSTNGDGDRGTGRLRAIAAAAHELRTSLTAILGFAEVLLLEGARLSESERDDMLGSIIANARAEEAVI